METITNWLVYLCLVLSTVAAFPYIGQPNSEADRNEEDFCSSLVVNKLLDSFQLPQWGSVLSGHARLRVKRDNPQNTNNVYLRRIMVDALTKLSNKEEIFGTFRNRQSFTGPGDKTSLLKREITTLLSELNTLQEKCLRNLDTGNDVLYDDDDESDFLQSQTTPTKTTIDDEDATKRTESEFDNTFAKRNDLAFNPSGWRKRRSSMERQQERVQNFLRNMRQLLDKRQEQRLNFNPTGW